MLLNDTSSEINYWFISFSQYTPMYAHLEAEKENRNMYDKNKQAIIK